MLLMPKLCNLRPQAWMTGSELRTSLSFKWIKKPCAVELNWLSSLQPAGAGC